MTGVFFLVVLVVGGGPRAGRASNVKAVTQALRALTDQSVERVIKGCQRGGGNTQQPRNPKGEEGEQLARQNPKARGDSRPLRMEMKMLAVLLASWLVLARSDTQSPKDDGTELPPPLHSEDLLQREIDPPKLWPLQEEIGSFPPDLQQEVLDLPLLIHGEPQSGLTPRSQRPSGNGCSRGQGCSGSPPLPQKLAGFPPGRPSPSNIDRICAAGREKITYGPWNLPQTGFSHLSRQGDALNDMEASLSRCCQLNEDQRLPCAQTTWSDVLEQFCNEEFSVKTRHYPCCKLQGARKERCFASRATFPNYDHVGVEALQGEKPSACSRGVPSQCKPKDLKAKLPAISFPPGRPSEANIKNICKLHKFRPIYPKDVLPASGLSWFVRQAQAINRLESKFKKCCRKEDVSCAHGVWEKTLTQYCKQEFSTKTKPHFCCKENEGEERLDCFANQAPVPAYDKEIQVVSLAEVTPSLLDLLCGQATLLSKQRHIPALIQNITEPCCTLQGDERTQCAQQEKSEFITNFCNSPRTSWKDPKKCCSREEEAARQACFDSSYLGNVTLASAGQPFQPTEPAP